MQSLAYNEVPLQAQRSPPSSEALVNEKYLCLIR